MLHAAKAGVTVSPLAPADPGTSIFRVSYHDNRGFLASARVRIQNSNGHVINAVDEGVDQHGAALGSQIIAYFYPQ